MEEAIEAIGMMRSPSSRSTALTLATLHHQSYR
jgi:hypothetical protein